MKTAFPSLMTGVPIEERSGLVFEYRPEVDRLLLVISQGQQQLTTELNWIFGSGSQAYTPVGLWKGRYFEHRVSFYTSANRPGRTLGHSGTPSRSLEEGLGQIQDPNTIYRCFNCHATNVKPGPDLSVMQPGITCERCHQGSEEHSRSPGKMRTVTASLTAMESVRFCGQCHRTPSPDSQSQAPEIDDPMSIRFQPIGFTASNCFKKSKAFSCISCHNPHENAQKSAEFYTAKCLSCHADSSQAQVRLCKRVNKTNCLPCHMPKRSPAEFLSFTDHRIRRSF
jgi:DNA-directed RNA polymerase subunit RPC12/RpoP